MRRVVITGIGTINACGFNVSQFWDNLVNGKSGLSRVTNIDLSNSPVQIGGEIKNEDFNPEEHIGRKLARRMDRFTQFAFYAAKEAITEANIEKTINHERIGVLIGSGVGGMQSFYDNAIKLADGGIKKVSPLFIPMIITNIIAGYISIEHGFKGPNYAVSSACASGAHAMCAAFNHIRCDDSDIVVTGGSEAGMTTLSFAGFSQSRALSTHFNDQPEKGSRPFDIDRDGFVMGEGAGILVFEELEHALRRKAKIYAEVISYGMSADAYHITAPCPDGSGAGLAMKNALDRAKLQPKDIQLINAHGTSTPLGDLAETKAIKSIFNESAYELKVNSTKSMTGHTLGAAGAIESIAIIKMLNSGKIHPTINLDSQDPDCDLNYVPNKAIEFQADYALSNSFGFGGHNVTLLFKKY